MERREARRLLALPAPVPVSRHSVLQVPLKHTHVLPTGRNQSRVVKQEAHVRHVAAVPAVLRARRLRIRGGRENSRATCSLSFGIRKKNSSSSLSKRRRSFLKIELDQLSVSRIMHIAIKC